MEVRADKVDAEAPGSFVPARAVPEMVAQVARVDQEARVATAVTGDEAARGETAALSIS